MKKKHSCIPEGCGANSPAKTRGISAVITVPLILAVIFILGGCGDSGSGDPTSPPPPPPPAGPAVYVAGYYTDAGFHMHPCYWKDGTRIDLDLGSAPGGEATAITVSGGSVYVAGQTAGTPCYWKDGSKTDLGIGGATAGYANAIAVSGGTVYAAGDYVNAGSIRLCYWQGGTKIDLPLPYYGGQTSGIFVVE
jgi:hypothetical protein